MQIKVKTIRNLGIIEKELNSISAGVIALPLDEGFEQIATSFVYYNTNIYLFIRDKEVFKNIKIDSESKFTAIREIPTDKKRKQADENIYSLFSISVTGILKDIDEAKLISKIEQSFFEKYSGRLIDSESNPKSFSKLICLDSKELIAIEETAT